MPTRRSKNTLPILFSATLLLSALLLFSIQPLVGKLLLPLLGGAPSVWNTVMVFFQAMLLLGYAYAHWSFRWFGFKWQPLVHFVLLAAAAIQLPFVLRATAVEQNPAVWVLVTLATLVGLPVFVLASTAPLLQKWFACSNDPFAKDPYFLYAASNVGSFAALLAYPVLMEPYLRLQTQAAVWSGGFWLLTGLVVVCALAVRNGNEPEETASSIPLKRLTLWKWIGLAFVPSSLMLGVTNYITTDIASVPLLWVVPLALYLLTFVIAFSTRTRAAEQVSSRAIPIAALAVVFPMLVQATEPAVVLVLLHLAFFFFAALQCHLKLARSRPPAGQLTQFYLYMSLGGVLGGSFNALLAPLIFNSIVEYPLVILAATLIGFPERRTRKARFHVPPVYGGAIIILAMTLGAALVTQVAHRNTAWGNTLAGVLLLASFILIQTPVRYTLAIATLLVCTSFFRGAQTRLLERERNFFGVLRVTEDPVKPLRKLYHGTTIHGIQSKAPGRECEPLSYYHESGPVGEITRLYEASNLPGNIGVVGLGAGAMITYSKPGENWILYEIDPAVVRIARDTNYFTYLSQCSPAQFQIELGDARLKLQAAPDQYFGLLYIDAFSSDVIPMHLLTLEALKLYRQKLLPYGILAFHVSSRNFELHPLVANLGQELGLFCFSSIRGDLPAEAIEEGGFESDWVILVSGYHLERIVASGTWQRVPPNPNGPVWTDDFSSLLGVLRLR